MHLSPPETAFKLIAHNLSPLLKSGHSEILILCFVSIGAQFYMLDKNIKRGFTVIFGRNV